MLDIRETLTRFGFKSTLHDRARCIASDFSRDENKGLGSQGDYHGSAEATVAFVLNSPQRCIHDSPISLSKDCPRLYINLFSNDQ